MPHEAPRVQAVVSCGSPEMPAMVSNAAPLKDAFTISRLVTPDGHFVAVERVNSLPLGPFPGFYFGPPREFSARFAPAQLSVLRI
jgi:hypothetical protein